MSSTRRIDLPADESTNADRPSKRVPEQEQGTTTPALTAEDLDAIAPMGVPVAPDEDLRAFGPAEGSKGKAAPPTERTVRDAPMSPGLVADKRARGDEEAAVPPRRTPPTLRPVTPTETHSMKRAREAMELADRIRAGEQRHGPTMLGVIGSSYRALAEHLMRGGVIPPEALSRVGDRRQQFRAAMATKDQKAAARLVAEDIDFKELYARALDIVRRDRERNPIPEDEQQRLEGLSDARIRAELEDRYAPGVEKHRKGKAFAIAEVSRAYGMRDEYQKFRAAEAQAEQAKDAKRAERYHLLAARVLADDYWYKEAMQKKIRELLRTRGAKGAAKERAE